MSAYTDEQLIFAARLYFVDGKPQAEVAKLVNVSQAKVSRMLALARERGLVTITVADSEPRALELESDLKDVLGIDAIVIRDIPGMKPADLRQMVGYFAAAPMLDWFNRAATVAIAGGRTIQAVVEHLRHPPLGGPMEFVQAMGTIDASPGAYDAVEFGLALARRWNGMFVRLNTPAILPDAETCERLLGLGQVKHVMGRLAAADLALVGVGTLENSVFVERGVLGPEDIEILRNALAVGEVLGRFYDHAGIECETPFRDRVVSMELASLKKVARRVGIIVGSDRTAAVLAAIRGGLLNAVVMDERGARTLLDLARSADGTLPHHTLVTRQDSEIA